MSKLLEFRWEDKGSREYNSNKSLEEKNQKKTHTLVEQQKNVELSKNFL